MRRVITLSLALFTAALGWGESALWNGAVRSFARNEVWQPGLIRVRFDQFNRRGEQISSSRSLLQVTVDENGELQTTVIESEEEGEDEESSGGPPFGDDDNAFAVLQISPFDPAAQDRVEARATGETRTIRGRQATAFAYTVTGEGRRNAVGTAWLATDSGAPLLLETSIEPLPVYLESFFASQSFGGNDDRWTADALSFEANVRFLLIRRRIESALEFSDYFRYQE